MRHRKNSKRLSRQSSHRKAVLRNQVKSLLVKESIQTTLALAKESRRLAEKLITMGKTDTVASRRNAYAVLADRTLVKLLFSDLAPRFNGRAGGYTRIIRLGHRHGDNAELVVLELTEIKKPVKEKTDKKTVKQDKKTAETKKEKSKPKKSEEAIEDAEITQVEEGDDKKGFLGGLRKFLKQDKAE